MFKCKSCGKEFPVVAWIETATTTYPNFSFQGANWPPYNQATINFSNWQSTTTIKKPVCPYCQQLDLEEIIEKDEFFETFRQELMKAIKDKIDADKKKEG